MCSCKVGIMQRIVVYQSEVGDIDHKEYTYVLNQELNVNISCEHSSDSCIISESNWKPLGKFKATKPIESIESLIEEVEVWSKS
jgi:hypothetical protein